MIPHILCHIDRIAATMVSWKSLNANEPNAFFNWELELISENDQYTLMLRCVSYT